MNRQILAAAAFALWSSAGSALALDATNAGWWNSVDNSNNGGAAINNTFTGLNGTVSGSNLFRSFYVFDLSGVSGPIGVGSTLTLGGMTYFSDDASETIGLFDVSTDIGTLTTAGSSAGVFADLGSGTSFGSATVDSGDNGTNLTFLLTQAAIEAINASLGGLFAIGAASQSVDTASNDGVRFDGALSLDLVAGTEVPAPGVLPLLGIGLLGLGLARRRRT